MELTLPDDVLEQLVDAISARLEQRAQGERSPWLTRAEAAEYLRLPVSRLEKDRLIPAHKDGGRVLYHRDELDGYVLGLGRES